MDIKDKIIKDIKEKDIKPTSKIYFTAKNILFWGFFIISVFVGSMAVSAIIFLIQINDWGMYRHVSNTLPGFVFQTLPYFWIVLFIIFIIIGYFNFRNIKGAYKIQKIFLITLILSVLFGVGLSKARMGMFLDDEFRERIPMYKEMRVKQFRMWDRPEKGIMIGEVTGIKEEYFVLSCGCRDWNVYGEKADLNTNVKVFGKRINNTDFNAERVFLVKGMPKFNCERKIKGMRINR